MNSPKQRTISTIKNEVEEKSKRRYQLIQQQKINNYYLLYKDQIAKIQRWFRNKMVERKKSLEAIALKNCKLRAKLIADYELKQRQFKKLQNHQKQMIVEKENKHINIIKQKIEEKLKRGLWGTLDCAEKLAESNSKAKFLMKEMEILDNEGAELQAEVQALRFEQSCHSRRKMDWQNKLKSLREAIVDQNTKIKEIQSKIRNQKIENNK